MKEEKIVTERSEVHRTYMYVYGTLGICLLGYVMMTVRYIYNNHQMPWLDILTEALLLLFLLSMTLTRTTYELHAKELVIIKASLFRTRKMAIPYSAMDGAFHFKVEPIKAISYRHTYRMYGNLDKRDIWSLVYNMPGTDKVSRVLMKASDEFWEEFEKRVPGRIRVSQNEVLKHAFHYISGAEQKKNRNRAKKAEAAALAAEEAKDAAAEGAEKPIANPAAHEAELVIDTETKAPDAVEAAEAPETGEAAETEAAPETDAPKAEAENAGESGAAPAEAEPSSEEGTDAAQKAALPKEK